MRKRSASILALVSLSVGGAWLIAVSVLWLTTAAAKPIVNVRWAPGIEEPQRLQLERELRLVPYAPKEPRTWSYFLVDETAASIRRLVAHPLVEDTAYISRSQLVLDHAPQGRMWLGHTRPIFGNFRLLLLSLLGCIAGGGTLLAGRMQQPAKRNAPARPDACSLAGVGQATWASSIAPVGIIWLVITLTCLPTLRSGDRINLNGDFLQFASRYEAVRKSLVEYRTVPLRSHWLGGGYPTVGDPEDPTLNPLVLYAVAFGTVKGLKLIEYTSLLIGGLGSYALARYVMGFTVWGALYSGLIYGTCLFVPFRILNGNNNEVYAAFLPLCLLLVGLACKGRKAAIVALPLVFCTMLSDGKLTCLMGMLFIGVLCCLDLIPGTSALMPAGTDSPRLRVNSRPLKFFLLGIGLTLLIGLARILPAEELIYTNGGIKKLLASLPQTYDVARLPAFTFEKLWKDAVGLEGQDGLVTVGWIPVLLSGISFIVFWRSMLAWGLALVLFVWLAMAHHAPVDLLRLLWHLPVFEAIHRPDKYFTFQIAFVLAIASGRSFSLLRQFRSVCIEGIVALALIAVSLSFLYPKAVDIHQRTYTEDASVIDGPSTEGFFSISGNNLNRARTGPSLSLAFDNLRRDIGTIDWYTGIPLPEYAVPKYFVDLDNAYVPNPKYRGEVFFVQADDANGIVTTPVLRPNSITVAVDVKVPDVLMINQNFHQDWRADRGSLFSREGLIALRLDTTGSYTVHLRYHPRSFYAGLLVTIVSLAGVMWVCWAFTSGRLQTWSHRPQGIRRQGSRMILWLIA